MLRVITAVNLPFNFNPATELPSEKYTYLGSMVDTATNWFIDSFKQLNKPAFSQVCVKLADGVTISNYLERVKKHWRSKGYGKLFYCWTLERSKEKQFHYHINLMCEVDQAHHIAVNDGLLPAHTKLTREFGGNGQFVGARCPKTQTFMRYRVLNNQEEIDQAYLWLAYSIKEITKPKRKEKHLRLIGVNQSQTKQTGVETNA